MTGRRTFSLYRVITLSVIAAWILSMALLVRREALTVIAVPGPAEVQAAGGAAYREEWLGLYYQGKKIGYMTTSYSPEDGGVHAVQKTYLKLQLMGKGEEATVLTDAKLAGDYTLRSFVFDLRSRSGGLRITGDTVPGGIEIYVRSGEAVLPQRIPLSAPPRLNVGLEQYLTGKGIEPGKKYLLSFFDPTVRKSVEMTVAVEGQEDVTLRGKTWHTYRVKETFQGMESTSWITRDGETIKEVSPIGYTSVLETRDEALTAGWPTGEGVDIIASSAIPSNVELEDPPLLSSLTVRVGLMNPSEGGLLKGFAGGKVLTVRRVAPGAIRSYRLPYGGSGMTRYLSADPFIQSTDPLVGRKAREIVGDETDAAAAVKKILLWVYRTLDQTPTFGLPSARDVLVNPTGDCKVHTIIFSALARSIGVPTKLMAGVVYRDGFFYYHAWPEVYLGGWVPVDPTFGQFPADVTHLPLTEGSLDDWITIMGAVGNLRIEVLKAL